MATANPVVVLEFNELSPRLMDEFISRGALPNFRRLREESQSYITDAGESAPFLEPWIQWVDVHTGRPYREHQVQYLGDDAQVPMNAIWDHISASDKKVWICGSMNATYRPGLHGHMLPDPWSINVRPSSPKFDPYLRFVRTHVLEYTRAKTPLSWREQLDFAYFMFRHGLRFSTAWAIVRQLLSEQFGATRWRRASILDRLQFDLFRYLLRGRPALATFFLNSTAHYQHVYWRNMEPALFVAQPSAVERDKYKDAILFGYQQMDRIVGETLDMVGDNATVIFMTALSQQPCLTYEGSGGKTFYKPISYDRLLEFAGIDPSSCTHEAVMSEQFRLRFRSAADAAHAERRLLTLKVADRAAIRCLANDSGFVAGCAIFEELPPDALLRSGSKVSLFSDIFYHVDLTKSGMHDRPGLLWIRAKGREPRRHDGIVQLTDVAPTILGLLGIATPPQMRGRDLLTAATPACAGGSSI